MKYPNAPFSFAKINAPVPGCTLSQKVLTGTTVFSLGSHTDISGEQLPQDSFLIPYDGIMEVSGFAGKFPTLIPGKILRVPAGLAAGVRAQTDTVYLDVRTEAESMNEILKAGEVIDLNELVPYREGQIVNMDLTSSPFFKYCVMAFDAGTGLDEHAAPGDAIVTALDGEGIIGYEGKEYPLKKGESFRFAAGGRHYVKAPSRFRMSLMVELKK
jgi:quercetin dioxygenase-like cupin family protein